MTNPELQKWWQSVLSLMSALIAIHQSILFIIPFFCALLCPWTIATERRPMTSINVLDLSESIKETLIRGK